MFKYLESFPFVFFEGFFTTGCFLFSFVGLCVCVLVIHSFIHSFFFCFFILRIPFLERFMLDRYLVPHTVSSDIYRQLHSFCRNRLF